MHRNVSHVDVVYWTRPHRILLRGTELNLEGLLWIALIVRIQKSDVNESDPRSNVHYLGSSENKA